MIKKRNLDSSLIQWIMSMTGLGPGVGEVHYLVPVGSSTSNFYEWLQTDMNVDAAYIHHTLANAEQEITAYRNDVILAFPGRYTETAELAWDKPQSHLIGLGGPNTYGDWAEQNVVFRTTGVGVVDVIDVTGQLCQFHNFAVNNYGANAACKSALQVDKYGLYFRNVRFQGNMTTQQCGNATCASLLITGNGFYPQFHDCIIGDNEWNLRTQADSGELYFPGAAGAPSNGLFKNCRFITYSNTNTVAMVAVPAVDYIGRAWFFDNCFFHCLSSNQTEGNRVFFVDTAGSDNIPSINLHQCFASNYAEWETDDNDAIEADMPVTATAGGIGQQPDGTVGN